MSSSETIVENFRDDAISFREKLYEAARSDKTLFPPPQRRKDLFLNIPRPDVDIIQREAWRKFFAEASLPRLVEVEYGSIISSRKVPDPSLQDSLTFGLSREYAAAISRTVARLADWIMAASISRGGRTRPTMRLRGVIWTYCLDFAAQLGQWDRFATWVDLVVRLHWQPTTVDGSIDHDQIKRIVERNRSFFEKRINMNWHEWLGAIDRGIDLRLAVSSPGSARFRQESKLAAVIRIVKVKHPDLAQREISGMVDDLFERTFKQATPILKTWKTHGVTTLLEAFDNPKTKARVKKYISEVT